MKYQGTFLNKAGQVVSVSIVTGGQTTPVRHINGTGVDTADGIGFAATQTVELEYSPDDCFTTLICGSATIRLQLRGFEGALFAADAASAAVEIKVGDQVVFSGFVEPQTYSQPFVDVVDDMELNCIDRLGALQYTRYKHAGEPGVDFDALLQQAGTLSFRQILQECLGEGYTLRYDGSKRLTAASQADLLDQIAVSELLFLGTDEDSTRKCSEVVEMILTYLDLHALQRGNEVFLFSRETTEADQRPPIAITAATAASTDSQVSVGECYNRLELTCSPTMSDELIEAPLDSAALTSSYTNRQRYMTEYTAHGEGKKAFRTFKAIVCGEDPDRKDAETTQPTRTDWYVQVKENLHWKTYDQTGADTATFTQEGTWQNRLPDHMAQHIGAAILSVGCNRTDYAALYKDNSPAAKLSMTDTLVISVNGNGKAKPGQAAPTADTLKEAAPLAVYTGAVTGALLSPPDPLTTNYLVFSGTIALNPRTRSPFDEILQTPDWKQTIRNLSVDGAWKQGEDANGREFMGYDYVLNESRKNKDGRYLARRWYKAERPDIPVVPSYLRGLSFFNNEDCHQDLEFKYSSVGDSADHISKVSVICCMLTIGDKCLVEIPVYQGSRFEWRPYKTRQQCASDDEYFAQSFTLGFNPKIGDKLIGTDFKIQNTVDFDMGLDCEGTAIPIRSTDALSGVVRFSILGPINTVWGEVTRRHPSFWRHTDWGQDNKLLLALVDSIEIRDFKVEIHSDNGKINNFKDSDIVYVSDTDESYLNVRDDLSFSICTALTAQEAVALGCAPTQGALSTPVVVDTGLPLATIYDVRRGQGKPEQLYVDAYWRRLHRPAVTLSLTVGLEYADPTRRYVHPALPGREFTILAQVADLMEATTLITLTQKPSDD